MVAYIPKTFKEVPNLDEMPSGKCDLAILAWVALAFEELKRLKLENAELKEKCQKTKP